MADRPGPLRAPQPLIDLRLFTNRVFAASITTMLLMAVALFGGMLLLPLYLQAVRGEGALESGLLMAPQGIGAMIAMPIAGQLADRTGVGRIVPVGLAIIASAFWWLTGLEADTSYWHLAIALFVMGIGMGFTMMPTMTGAMQTLRRASVPNASTTLNITQQVGTSIGTAALSVVLATALTNRLGGGASGGSAFGALSEIPPQAFARIQPLLAGAFGESYWWAFGLVGVAFVVAITLLPKRKPAPVEDDEGATTETRMMRTDRESPLTTYAEQTRPLRADAERNRRRILAAAREVFARRGLEAGLDEIGRHAGVGTGTVYRRFPEKVQLVTALFEDRLDQMLEHVQRAAEHPDPWEGLAQAIESMAQMQVEDRGLKDVIFSEVGDTESIRDRRNRFEPLIMSVVERAKSAGVLRPDVELTDFPALQIMLTQLATFADPVKPDLWRRYLRILLDGLRNDQVAPSPLGQPALTMAEFEAACGRRTEG